MPDADQSNQSPAPPPPPSEAGPAILPGCRAARIADVTDFANCLVEAGESCPNGFVSAGFHYCEHPQREAIIARTLAADPPPSA